tara:strand:+ start:156 stop:764 length:609 start_codon:yes stop_codon:yes gene_type:complete
MSNGEPKFTVPDDKRFYAEPVGNRYRVTDNKTNKIVMVPDMDSAKMLKEKILNTEKRTFVPSEPYETQRKEYEEQLADPTKGMSEEKKRLYRLQNQIGDPESLQQDSSNVYTDVEKYIPANIWKPKVEMLFDDIQRNKQELASYENEKTGTGANRDYNVERGIRKRAYGLMKKIADDERELERLKNLKTNQEDPDPLGLFND